MEVLIKETNTAAEINYMYNQINVVCDVVGNAGAFADGSFVEEIDEDGDPSGRWICTQDTFDWWENYIAAATAADTLKREAEDTLSGELRSKFLEECADVSGYDLADQPAALTTLCSAWID